MKKILFCIALAIAAVACDTQPDATLPGPEKAAKLNFVTQDYDHIIESDGGTTTIKFLSTKDWTARIIPNNSLDKEDWCVLKTTSGVGDETNAIELKVVANPNTTYTDRYATVYVTSGNYNKSTKVTQKQLDHVEISQTQYNVTAQGETINVNMKCNVVCKEVIEEGVDWIRRVDNIPESASRAYAPMIYRFEVSPNTTGQERQTEIKFVYKELSKSVTVIQAAEDEE